MGRFSSTRLWVGRRTILLAAAVWVLSLAALTLVPLAETPPAAAASSWPAPWSLQWWVGFAVVTLQSGAVLFVSRRQSLALILVSVLALPLATVASWDALTITSVAIIATTFAAVLAVEVSHIGLALLCTFLVTACGYIMAGPPEAGLGLPLLSLQALGQAAVTVVLPTAIALVVRSRGDVRRAQANEHKALERERDAHVQSALARERTELARELHDIAAHHMSGIAVMASAIERQIDGAPESAKEGAVAVREQSRLVLADLRRLVGLLREDDEVGAAVYAIAAIKDLAARAPAKTELKVHPGLEEELGAGLGPLSQLVGYRMVQESLANAARHAPGAPCLVVIDDRDRLALSLRVSNEPSTSAAASPGSGFGLLGMSERAELVGAVLHYGPTLEGGWEVSLRLPREVTDIVHPHQLAGEAS